MILLSSPAPICPRTLTLTNRDTFVSGVVVGTVEVSGVDVGAEVEGAEVGAAASKDCQ